MVLLVLLLMLESAPAEPPWLVPVEAAGAAVDLVSVLVGVVVPEAARAGTAASKAAATATGNVWRIKIPLS
jgi:hypothetical protein